MNVEILDQNLYTRSGKFSHVFNQGEQDQGSHMVRGLGINLVGVLVAGVLFLANHNTQNLLLMVMVHGFDTASSLSFLSRCLCYFNDIL